MNEQTGPDAAGSLFDHYTLGAAWDEMLAEPGAPRTAYKPVFHTLRAMNAGTLKERADTLARSYLDQGVTFDFAGEERPFPLDAVPRVIAPHEWQVIESGVEQRVTALEAFLDDIYSREGEIPRAVHDGVIPRRLIASSTHFHRAVVRHRADQRRARPRRGHRPDPRRGGRPSGCSRTTCGCRRGVSYVIDQPPRDGQRLPRGLRRRMRIRPVARLPARAARRPARRGPRRRRATRPSSCSPRASTTRAYFEHALLARMMGVELVEGRDLVCVGGRVLDAHHARATSRSTSSTAGSTTSSSTRCTSAATRCSASPG